jgi:hypothetical protein
MAGLVNLVQLEGDPCWSNTGDGQWLADYSFT